MSFPLDLETFRERFKEFGSAPSDDVVQSALDEAEREIDEDVWDDKAEDGHGWLTADLLTHRGYGREVPKNGVSSYGRRFERLQQIVGGSYRVVLE